MSEEMSPEEAKLYARNTDPGTSHESAAKLRVRQHWYLVLAFLIANNRPEGWTDWEIECGLRGRIGLCPWHRVSDVRREGWAVWATNEDGKPIKRTGESNRLRQASRVTQAGVEWFEKINQEMDHE